MLKWFFAVMGVLFLAVSGTFVYLYVAATRLPENAPRVFLKQPAAPGQKVVVCLGDSLTHGRVSHNYVAELAARYPDHKYRFVNAGINSELAYSALQRTAAVITLKPDYVILFIGANDALAAINPKSARRYIDMLNLPQTPTKQWFRMNLSAIVDRLKQETRAKIALMSLPPLTEEARHPGYRCARTYSAVIRKVAAEKQVAFLPLHAKMSSTLSTKTTECAFEFVGPERVLTYKAIVEHYLLGRSWNSISEKNGFVFLTDFIHLNEKGAGIVADLIEAFIRHNQKDFTEHGKQNGS